MRWAFLVKFKATQWPEFDGIMKRTLSLDQIHAQEFLVSSSINSLCVYVVRTVQYVCMYVRTYMYECLSKSTCPSEPSAWLIAEKRTWLTDLFRSHSLYLFFYFIFSIFFTNLLYFTYRGSHISRLQCDHVWLWSLPMWCRQWIWRSKQLCNNCSRRLVRFSFLYYVFSLS